MLHTLGKCHAEMSLLLKVEHLRYPSHEPLCKWSLLCSGATSAFVVISCAASERDRWKQHFNNEGSSVSKLFWLFFRSDWTLLKSLVTNVGGGRASWKVVVRTSCFHIPKLPLISVIAFDQFGCLGEPFFDHGCGMGWLRDKPIYRNVISLYLHQTWNM